MLKLKILSKQEFSFFLHTYYQNKSCHFNGRKIQEVANQMSLYIYSNHFSSSKNDTMGEIGNCLHSFILSDQSRA